MVPVLLVMMALVLTGCVEPITYAYPDRPPVPSVAMDAYNQCIADNSLSVGRAQARWANDSWLLSSTTYYGIRGITVYRAGRRLGLRELSEILDEGGRKAVTRQSMAADAYARSAAADRRLGIGLSLGATAMIGGSIWAVDAFSGVEDESTMTLVLVGTISGIILGSVLLGVGLYVWNDSEGDGFRERVAREFVTEKAFAPYIVAAVERYNVALEQRCRGY